MYLSLVMSTAWKLFCSVCSTVFASSSRYCGGYLQCVIVKFPGNTQLNISIHILSSFFDKNIS